MKDYTFQNKKAWEYTAYDFWLKAEGQPTDFARKIKQGSIFGFPISSGPTERRY